MRAATATPTTPATIAGRPEKVAAPFCDDDELGADELSAADEALSDEVGLLDSELDESAPPAADEELESDEAADDDFSEDELCERCDELPEVEAAPPAAPPLPPLELLLPLEELLPLEQSVEPWPTVTGAEAAPAPLLSVT